MSRSNDETRTLITWAVDDSNLAHMREYLLEGHNPNLQNDNGETALHIAAKSYKMDVASLLLQFGADPDIENNKGEKPDYYAAYFNPNIQDNKVAKFIMSMSIAISSRINSFLFGKGGGAMKQANHMFEKNSPEEMKKIIAFKHLSPDLLQAIVVRIAEKPADQREIDLVTVLNTIIDSNKAENWKLNFLQDTRVISKICDALKEISPEERTAIINKLKEINTTQRTVNYKMLEQAQESKQGTRSRLSSLWYGTIAATKDEYKHLKDVINKSKPGNRS